MTEPQAFSNHLGLSMSVTLLIILPLLSLIILGRWKIPPPFPKDIPWPGGREKRYAKIRASYRGWPSALSNLSEGYRKYNLQGQPYVHATPSLRPQVILPVKDFEWLIHLPDSMVSVQEAMNESAGLAHLLTGRSATLEKMATVAISQHLTSGLGRVQVDLINELQLTFDQVLGLDTHEWKSICIFPAMEQAVTQITTRLLFGLPLCRSKGYLRALIRCMHCFGAGMIVCAQLLPWFLQPVLSIFFRIPLKFALWILSSYTKPLITHWLTQIEQEDGELGSNSSEVPYNLATSFIRIARKHTGNGKKNIPQIISCINQIAILPFGTLIPSSCAMFLDVASKTGLSQSLQQEAATVLGHNAAWEDLASFKKLQLIESSIKETLRLSPMLLHASNREIIHADGLTLPTGQHLPRGTWVGASTLDVHLDERFYPDPTQYNPSRFLLTCQEPSESQNISRLATTKSFLSFGAGRHAW
ncbi:hypothetical protein BDV12DRAFT_170032 [Aspergillus spectabilis]